MSERFPNGVVIILYLASTGHFLPRLISFRTAELKFITSRGSLGFTLATSCRRLDFNVRPPSQGLDIRPSVLKTDLMNVLRFRLTSPIHMSDLCFGEFVLNLVNESNIKLFPTLWPGQRFTDYLMENK